MLVPLVSHLDAQGTVCVCVRFVMSSCQKALPGLENDKLCLVSQIQRPEL